MVPRPASWSASRQFGIVIDAGSSGSRVQVYSWITPDVARQLRKQNKESLEVLSRVEKGVEKGDGWNFKVEPGISTFSSHPELVGDYLRPLLDFARTVIPSSQHSTTPLYLLATAGMRLLPPQEQNDVLLTACAYLQSSNFLLPDCAEHVRIITGEEEGLYGWIAVNYLMDGFDSHLHLPGLSDEMESSTYGFLDMGGASTQIAFEPSRDERVKHADNLLEVRLSLLSGRDVIHPVFVTTWLGFGTNQARERYVDQEIRRYLRASDEAHVHHSGEGAGGGGGGGATTHGKEVLVDDACLPKSLMLSESRHQGYTLRGTGDFDSCVRRQAPLLNKDVVCLDDPCLFNGVHVPKIDFDVNHFIGISEYFYSTQDVWVPPAGVEAGVYDFVEFEKNARKFCGREWDEIMNDHKAGSGGWKATVELGRLETQCFKAAWVVNVLHDGIGIPRIIDQGGEGDGLKHAEIGGEKAKEKGLTVKGGRKKKPPSFQSVNTVGDVAVSWTLGKMVLEVSRQARAGESKNGINESGSSSWTRLLNGSGRPSDIPTTPVLAFVGFTLAAVYFFFISPTASRRRKSFLGGLTKSRRPSDFVLLSQEDGAMSEGGSNGARTPGGSLRRNSPPSMVTRALAPARYVAYRLSSFLRTVSQPRPTLTSSVSTGSLALPTSTMHLTNSTYPLHVRPRSAPPPRSTKSLPVGSVLAPGGPPPGVSGTTIGSTTTHWNDAPDFASVLSDKLSRAATTNVASGAATTGDEVTLVSSRPPSRGATSAGTAGLSKLSMLSAADSVPVGASSARRYGDPGTPPGETFATFIGGGDVDVSNGGRGESPVGFPTGGVGAKLRPTKSAVNLVSGGPGTLEVGRGWDD
ncbi:hypothetical protein T439DRAFT_309014 [Meredithblackwellia eburnea MCA 4105]